MTKLLTREQAIDTLVCNDIFMIQMQELPQWNFTLRI